ncbi:MAG: S24/S26 family peptidase, partial [Candidatus Acidiferrales bacterium]
MLKTLEKRDSRQFAVVCEAALDGGLRVRFRADGRSMQPNVLDGDTVVVAPISAGKPRRGDIALTRGDRGFVLHRVIGWDQT